MFINKIHLQNFKRFTGLTIDLSGLAVPPKLVLMIGANGSGKSSVFDAFESVSYSKADESSLEKTFARFKIGQTKLYSYFQKESDNFATVKIVFYEKRPALISATGDKASPGKILTNNRRYADSTKTFYGRSTIRQVPRLLRTSRQANEETIIENSDKPASYIEEDLRFENDLDIQTDRILRDVFEGQSYETQEIRERYVKPINDALARIFVDGDSVNLRMHTVIPPLNGKPTDLRFRKGTSDIHYDLLSSGEKEVINILFNLLTRKAFFDDTIYFIDELDAHLNTALQYNLLKEITENWLPENCQLWTASHSLGFIKYAQETEAAAILDFDQIDFDLPQTLVPLPKDTTEIFEIAVPADILPSLFKDRQVFLCENKNDKLYQRLEFEGKIFLGIPNKDAVYYRVKTNPAVYGLIDRDYLTEGEIGRIREKFPRLFVLRYYAFENYLYHPDNLAEAIPGFEVEPYKQEIQKQKNLQLIQTVADLKESRSSYKVLRDENLTEEDGYLKIAQELQSDDFETFYPHFNMKSKFTAKPNVRPEVLVSTKWFRNAISKALEL